MEKKANLLVVLRGVSSRDNHTLTVQMRKWLIGLVINIMSYYPGQVEKLFHQARLYLSWFTYAPVQLISEGLTALEITVFFFSSFSFLPFVAPRWLGFNYRKREWLKMLPFLYVKMHIYEFMSGHVRLRCNIFGTPSLGSIATIQGNVLTLSANNTFCHTLVFKIIKQNVKSDVTFVSSRLWFSNDYFIYKG